MIITIDGPSASGKSTLAHALAKTLNFFYLNTGYMYRSIAYILMHHYDYTIETLSQATVAELDEIFNAGHLVYQYDGVVRVFYKDVDIAPLLKEATVSRGAAVVGAYHEVRERVVRYVYSLVAGKDCVAEGRALGSGMFPHAELKIFLMADAQIRAQRDFEIQKKLGVVIDLQKVTELLHARDEADQNRVCEPLVIPEGATIIDTSRLNKDEVLQKVVHLVRQHIQHRI